MNYNPSNKDNVINNEFQFNVILEKSKIVEKMLFDKYNDFDNSKYNRDNIRLLLNKRNVKLPEEIDTGRTLIILEKLYEDIYRHHLKVISLKRSNDVILHDINGVNKNDLFKVLSLYKPGTVFNITLTGNFTKEFGTDKNNRYYFHI